MTVSVNQLAYIGFGVSEPDGWASFLTETLGLQESEASKDGTRHFRLDDHRSRIQVQSSGEDDLVYLGWLVRDRHELVAMEDQLVAAGYQPQRASKDEATARGMSELVVVTDPCGLRTEIGCGPAISSTPFVPGRPLVKGFVAGDQGVGHVVIKSTDPDGYVHFYEETLGLGVSDHVVNPGMGPMPGFSIAFYHANARHHSLAFPLIALPPMGKRIQHFMVQLEDLDDLGRGMQTAYEKKELLNFLGRHSNDLMLSCYLTTPGGVGVEYGWGSRSVGAGEPTQTFTEGDLWGHQVGGERSIFDIVAPPGKDGPPGAPGAPGPVDERGESPVLEGRHA